MAMARPVVAAPVGSIPELVVNGQTGLLAETGNARSFADALGTLLGDQELRSRLGSAARRHVLAGYTDRIMVEQTVAFYERLLAHKQRKLR
jgi:glycosyltransferase involved in cell wall biosynthesis